MTRPHGTRLTEEDKARIFELRSQGMPPKEIAVELDISERSATRWSGEHKRPGGGINKHTRPPDWEDEDVSTWPTPYPQEERYPEDLPDLEIDEFNWTQEELDDAVREARRLLFPTEEETS